LFAVAIGWRVSQERQSRKWTLDQLAEAARARRRCQGEATVVVNVEQGGANVSVGVLLGLVVLAGAAAQLAHGRVSSEVSTR
jgi:transcriptional regulator with XRE-family HTH domain